jgi:hypothetical protein
MAKWLGITTIVAGLIVAGFAIFTYPDSFDVTTSDVTLDVSALMYQDACVVEVTHPELQIELVEVTSPKEGCVNCRYMFRVWNQTAAVGTKAYRMSIWLVPLERPVEYNGREIEVLKLHGYITELKTLEYPIIRDEDFFAIDALCPGCINPEDALIKLMIEYYDCSGIHRFECVLDLRNYNVTVLRQSFEPCSDCGC